jgi:hypothetical protein
MIGIPIRRIGHTSRNGVSLTARQHWCHGSALGDAADSRLLLAVSWLDSPDRTDCAEDYFVRPAIFHAHDDSGEVIDRRVTDPKGPAYASVGHKEHQAHEEPFDGRRA